MSISLWECYVIVVGVVFVFFKRAIFDGELVIAHVFAVDVGMGRKRYLYALFDLASSFICDGIGSRAVFVLGELFRNAH